MRTGDKLAEVEEFGRGTRTAVETVAYYELEQYVARKRQPNTRRLTRLARGARRSGARLLTLQRTLFA